MKQVYVIVNLSKPHLFYNNNMNDFDRIERATLYPINDQDSIKNRLIKLPEGFYEVRKIIINK